MSDASDPILRHCEQIERCNQRGGRMLSIVDLVEAGTISRPMAAYALAAISHGASFLVGANPGGAGKTTVMGALLNFVPPAVELEAADSLATIERGMRSGSPRRCWICHEIGAGGYYGYLQGEELRAYFRLPEAGHMLATNLHADTYRQVREQVCGQNGVPEEHLWRVNLMFFLAARRHASGIARRVVEVWESDGTRPHRQVYGGKAIRPVTETSALVSGEQVKEALKAIDKVQASGARTIEQVRALVTGAPGV